MKLSELHEAGGALADAGRSAAERVRDTATEMPRSSLQSSADVSGKLAYLVNVYPKISHSFIRTEIAALERAGLQVAPFTIRRTSETFSDPEDRREAERTVTLLDGNAAGLARAVLRSFLSRPVKSLRALWFSLRAERSPLHAFAYFAEAALLAKEMERRHIAHVHVHFGTNPVAVARLASRLAGISYSFTAHGPDEFDAPRALNLPGKIADAAFAVGVSSFGRSQLMRWSDPVHWDRIKVVRCAVAPHFLESRSDAGLQTKRLISVARLSAQKGLPLLLAAAARVAATHDFTLDIIGDGEDRAMLEAQIRQLNLHDHVRLLGWRSSDDVREELTASRALVLPSFAEGLPVVLMEALALGRPTVTTAIAGIPELVDGANGWLVPSGSIDAIAEAMQAVLEASPEQLQSMGEIGRERVRTMHDPDTNARYLAQLLTPVI